MSKACRHSRLHNRSATAWPEAIQFVNRGRKPVERGDSYGLTSAGIGSGRQSDTLRTGTKKKPTPLGNRLFLRVLAFYLLPVVSAAAGAVVVVSTV